MADPKPIWIRRGDTSEWTLPITKADGSIKDLTGATNLVFLVKTNISDLDAAAVITATPTVSGDPTSGIVAIKVNPADSVALVPGGYVYAVQLKDGEGNTFEFPEPEQFLDPSRRSLGQCYILPDVVRATP